MQHFVATGYSETDTEANYVISTPLGILERRYLANSRGVQFKQVRRHQSATGNSTIAEWNASGCLLEELMTLIPLGDSEAGPAFTCLAVMLRIKATAHLEDIHAQISWLPGYRWVEGCGEPGEGIEARSWIDEGWKVVIGTENTDELARRARSGIWMPVRLASFLSTDPVDVVQVRYDSISIHLPALNPLEDCQLQFVIASGHRGDTDTALWIAIDQRPNQILLAGQCK